VQGSPKPLIVKRADCFFFSETDVSLLPLKELTYAELTEGDAVVVASQGKTVYVSIPNIEAALPSPLSSPAGGSAESGSAAFDIQLEVNKLAATGGTVHLPNGIYPISKPIVVPSNVSIEGDGTNTVILNRGSNYAIRIVGTVGATTLIRQDIPQGGGVGTSRPVIRVESATGFVVGTTVKILKDNAFPVKIEFNKVFAVSGNQITFQDNFCEGYRAADAVKVIAINPVRNVSIRNLTLSCDAGTAGFGVFAINTEHLLLKDLRLSQIARKSIHIDSSYFPRIENNTLTNNGRPGDGDYGIGSNLNMGATIVGNKLASSGAIVVKGNLNTLVRNNQTDSTGLTGGDGISVISTVGSTLDSNIVSRGNCYGIWMHHSSERNSISNNQFGSGITSAIYVTDNCTDNLISDNVLTNNNGNGISVDDTSGRNSIRGNLSLRNRGRGIMVYGDNNLIIGNTVRQSGLEPLLIRDGRNNVSRDNITQ
jgi:parallel beta-helix repeat protein